MVSQSYGLNDTAGSGDDSDASDLEVMDVSYNISLMPKMASVIAQSNSIKYLVFGC